MFILLISRGFPTNKYPQWGCFEKDQAEALSAYGHRVVVISVDARFKKSRGSLGIHHINSNGVNYYNYVVIPSKIIGARCYKKYFKYHYYNKLYNIVELEYGKPDIIYSHFYFNTAASLILKEKYHIPLVSIEHLARFNNKFLIKKIEHEASIAFRNCNSLIAVSKSLAKNIERHFGRRCEVVYNMFGKEFEVNQPINTTTTDQIVFVSVASLVYRKGFDILIKAFAKANLPSNSWKLNIIGGGEEREKLESLVNENALCESIHFLGEMNKSQIVNELQNSNVFILASRSETFGLVFVEAMTQGLPVIGTICGGPEEFINDNNGIIVPKDDVDAMSKAITRMMEMYSHYDKEIIAENCKKLFSPQAIAKKLTDIFESVLNS